MSNTKKNTKNQRSRVGHIASALALSLAVSACGGGAISPTNPVIPTSPPATPPTTPLPTPPIVPPSPPASTNPNDYLTTEFLTGRSLEAVGAQFAYAAGLTGQGVIIGILDFNFNFSSPELNISPASRPLNQNYLNIYEAQIGETAPTDPHGHAVAVFAAGKKNTIDTHGVAFNATVLAVDYFSGVYVQDVLQSNITYHVSDPYRYMTDQGAKVINISIGYDEDDIITNPPPVTERYVNASAINAIANGAILVAAAGNAGHPEPMLSNLEILDEGLANGYISANAGSFIMVGSVDENNVISDFSDRAGRAANYFMVAPGEQVVFPWTNDTGSGLFVGDGTSFAAPLVTGAAALLFQQWPQLSPNAVANILFTTATDLGTPGVDVIYGHGLLNIQAAISPIGNPVGAIAGSSVSVPISSISLVLGQAFGDAVPEGLTHFMGLDDFNRDFYFDLSNQIQTSTHFQTSLGDALLFDQTWGSSQLQLGKTSASFFVMGSRESDTWLQAQPQYLRDTRQLKQATGISLSGTLLNLNWLAGHGISLNQALNQSLDHQRGSIIKAPLSLAHESDPYLARRGTFAALSVALGKGSSLLIGVDYDTTSGHKGYRDPFMRADYPRYSALMQYNKITDDFGLQARVGYLQETGTMLGSRASQGMSIANTSTTQFVGLKASYHISSKLDVVMNTHTSLTEVNSATSSYIQSVSDFISTAWSAKIIGRDFMRTDATWSIGLYQPLRAENARISVMQPLSINYSTGLPLYEARTYALAPSGREITLEAAWRYESAGWMVQSSLLRRQDAAHVSGNTDTAALMWFKVRF